MKFIIQQLFILTTFFLSVIPQYVYAQTYSIKGRVTSATDNSALGYSTLIIEPWGIATVADANGNFSFNKVAQGECIITVSSLGFQPLIAKLDVEKNTRLEFKLEELSFSLNEVSVMGKQRKGGEKVDIGQSAIEYIQPTSLHDIMLLLPGSVVQSNSFSGFKQISVRQAGSDMNTSLGVGLIVDGVAMTNDGMRNQLAGYTPGTASSLDAEYSEKNPINQGNDLRYISTDHIESVEISKGISSAKFGDLSSGVIQVNSKKGQSPLRVRAKADLKNKLAYIGKGVQLGRNGGSLNLGVDYLHSMDDIREELEHFSRITAQAFYNNQWTTGLSKINLDARVNQTISVNKARKDELAYKYHEHYISDYKKTGLMLKTSFEQDDAFVSKINFLASSEFVSENIDRLKFVTSGSSALSAPISNKPGENIGQFLPGMYYSAFQLDNKPVNIFAQLNAETKKYLSKSFLLKLDYGLDLKLIKNRGEGVIISDPTRPPYPFDNTYIRPRRNIDIPAIINGAAYLQSDWIYYQNDDVLKLSVGIRATQMMNLPDNYVLKNKAILDPRINLSYILNTNDNTSHSFRAGFGIESKLPTLDYLYPDKVYKDFNSLNSFSSNPDYRILIVHTHVFDVANKDLEVNQNKKYELGYDFEYNGLSVALTGFYENSQSGFGYSRYFTNLNYDLYREFKGDPVTDRTPAKEDYIRQDYNTFTSNSIVNNNNTVRKLGLEYRIVSPHIRAISSQIEVNGAYYSTKYSTTLPMQFYPGMMIANNPYPYVGIYNNYPSDKQSRLNTNVWINTHIPKFGIMFTNFFQCVWINSSQYNDERNIYPYQIMETDGTVRPVTDDELKLMSSFDPTYRYLKRAIFSVDYASENKPVSLMWNIKATKELNNKVKLSFFVDNIIDINPFYKDQYNRKNRSWTNPYFGLEVFLNF